ncbi:MAG TPA: UUP1 family membrane protein, partial [Luteolibacter sp.]|nr:UUP1 family membrane protein [Luteolibacter sp.]
MSDKWKLAVAVIALLLVGSGVAAYKTLRLGIPFWRGEQVHDWQIEARVSFLATGRAVKARLSLPATAVENRAGQESGSLGYHYNIDESNIGEYAALWSASQREDSQALYYRLRIPESMRSGGEPLPAAAVEAVNPGFTGQLLEAATAMVTRATSLTNDPDSLFVAIFEQIQGDVTSQEFVVLKRHYDREYGPNAIFQMGIDLLQMAGVPARIAYGVKLDERETGSQQPLPLVEYCDGAYWKVRDPAKPGSVLDGREIFVWHRGGGPLLEVTGGEGSRVVFTVARERIPMATLADLRESPLLVSTILGLPLSERAVFRYVVLIPLGAFVVVVLRNIVGVATLGTFMPVLIALALLEIPLARGLLMFSVLIAAGLWFRFLLSRLNLLVVPRVAACVVIVTLLMMLLGVL